MTRAALYLVILGLLMIIIGLGSGLAMLAAPILLGLSGLLLVTSVVRDSLRPDWTEGKGGPDDA